MISVCMATYNGERYIMEQIESILEQLGEDDELIVSDDNSTDRTLAIINDIGDKRIKVVINNGISGYTGNYYNSLKQAKGEYVFLADQDDVWLPGKVRKLLGLLETYDFVISDAKEVDEDLSIKKESRISSYRMKRGFINNLCRSRYIGCCMAFNRKVLESIFPPPTYTNDYPHDLWIALIAEKYYKTFLFAEPLILYRRHGKNASDGGAGSKRSIIIIVKQIIIRFYYLHHVLMQKKHIINVKKRYKL